MIEAPNSAQCIHQPRKYVLQAGAINPKYQNHRPPGVLDTAESISTFCQHLHALLEPLPNSSLSILEFIKALQDASLLTRTERFGCEVVDARVEALLGQARELLQKL